MARFTDEQKRAAAVRECQMRRRVYGRWVEQGKMTEADAEAGIAVMEEIAEDYQRLVDVVEATISPRFL